MILSKNRIPYTEDLFKKPAHLHPVMEQSTLFTLGVGNKPRATYHQWQLSDKDTKYKITTTCPYTLGAKELRLYLLVVYLMGLEKYQSKQEYNPEFHRQSGIVTKDINAIVLTPRELLTRLNDVHPSVKEYCWLKSTLRSFDAIHLWIEHKSLEKEEQYGTYCMKSHYVGERNSEKLSISISPLMAKVAMRSSDSRYAIHYLEEQRHLSKIAVLLHYCICNRQHPGLRGVCKYKTETLRDYLYQDKPHHHEQIRRTKKAMYEIAKLPNWNIQYNEDRDVWTVGRP